MIDMLMRSIGLDPAKMQDMMEQAGQEYQAQVAAINKRFDDLEMMLESIKRQNDEILTHFKKDDDHGYGATQLGAIAQLGNAECIDGSGCIEPIVGSYGGTDSGD